MIRLLTTVIAFILSPTIQAQTFDTDLYDAVEKANNVILDLLNSSSSNVPLALFKILLIVVSLIAAIKIIGYIVRTMVNKGNAEKKQSLFSIAMGLLKVMVLAVLASAIILYAAFTSYFVMKQFMKALIPIFVKETVINAEKIKHDTETKAYKYFLTEYINKGLTYHLSMDQLQRYQVFVFRNSDLNDCLRLNYTYEYNGSSVLTDKNSTTFNYCSRKYIGADSISFGLISNDSPYDAVNKSVASLQNDIAQLSYDIHRSNCVSRYDVNDENDYLKNCSEIKDGSVVVQYDYRYVQPMLGDTLTDEVLITRIKAMAHTYASIISSNLAEVINERTEAVNKHLGNLDDVSAFSLISITFKAASLDSAIQADIDKLVRSNSIALAYYVDTKNTAEKSRYLADKLESDKYIDSYDTKRKIDTLVEKSRSGGVFTNEVVRNYINSTTNGLFNQNGFSNPECVTDHTQCNMPNANMLSTNISFGFESVKNSSYGLIGYYGMYIYLKTVVLPNVYSNLAVKVVAKSLKETASYYKVKLVLGIVMLLTILLTTVMRLIGNYGVLFRLVLAEIFSTPLKIIFDSTDNKLEVDEDNYDLFNLVFAIFLSCPLFVISFFMYVFAIYLGSVILQFSIFTFMSSVSGVSPESVMGAQIFDLAAHVVYYIVMGFVVYKASKTTDEQFVYSMMQRIIGSSAQLANSFADDAESFIKNVINRVK